MLQVHHLTAGHNGQVIVSIPNLALQPGQTCLLSGQSGSGKTTLLHALAGFGTRISGDVKVNQTNLYSLKRAARDRFRGQHIGLIFQTLHLVKSLTVMENLLLAPFVTKQLPDTTHAESLLAKLGIADLKDKPATAISQGQAQRVAIARALLNKPFMLLADEPTSSLDDQAAENVMQTLLALTKESGTVLVVSSHDHRIQPHFDQQIKLGA